MGAFRINIASIRGYEPSHIEDWHHGPRYGTKNFWCARTIAAMRRTMEYARAAERASKRRQQLDEIQATRTGEAEARKQAEKALDAELPRLSLDGLVQLALECLHAANRAAKHAGQQTRSTVYTAKDAFLSAMVRTARATVGTFEVEEEGRSQICTACGREWVGSSYCYSCDDAIGVAALERHRWYLVDCGAGYRFHRPSLDADLMAFAVPIEPHDPTQEPRAVPTVCVAERPLDLTAQLRVLRSAAERLATLSVPTCASTTIPSGSTPAQVEQ